MKKIFIVLFVIMFIVPFKASADMAPISINGYAVQATEGSEIVLSITGYDMMDGTLKYNKEELKYVSMRVEDPTIIEGEYVRGSLKITKNNPGELSFKYQQYVEDGQLTEEKLESVLVKFVVLKVPESKKINIKYIPDNNEVLYGESSHIYTFVIRNPKDEVITTDDTDLGDWTNNPKPYTSGNDGAEDDNDISSNPQDSDNENDTCPKCTETESKEDNTLLYVSWGVSGLLFLALVIVLFKNRKKKV